MSPGSGSADAGSTSVPSVEVDVNPAGLAAGSYYGQIELTAPGTDNSPQFVSVVLNVLPAGSRPGPVVRPARLIFAAVAGGSNPGSQTVELSNLTAAPISFTSSQTFESSGVISYLPASGTVSPDSPGRIVVQPDITRLTPGVRQGVLTLLFDQDVRYIDLILVIAPPPSSSSQSKSADRPLASGCAPKKFIPVITSLGAGFSLPASWPATVEAKIVDDCGNPMTAGSVVTTFSNGDLPFALASLKDGRWTGTWQVRQGLASQVTVAVSADDKDLGIHGSSDVTGGLQANAGPPVLNPGGVVSTASLGPPDAPLAPGSLVSISGAGLSAGQSESLGPPLDTQLAGTVITVGGKAVPLSYASNGLVRGIFPYDLPVNVRLPLLIRRQSSLGVPESITVAVAQPEIFTKDGSGGGQGQIFDSQNQRIEAGNPAKSGDTISIYCAGLGAVDPAVPAGAAAPDAPLSPITSPLTLTIGGIPAVVTFAGLAPREVGVYQVNAVIPDNVPAGDGVPVVITVAGQSSTPVTMAAR
jgi:uncharacterized protein (TIGR03437 family)